MLDRSVMVVYVGVCVGVCTMRVMKTVEPMRNNVYIEAVTEGKAWVYLQNMYFVINTE